MQETLFVGAQIMLLNNTIQIIKLKIKFLEDMSCFENCMNSLTYTKEYNHFYSNQG